MKKYDYDHILDSLGWIVNNLFLRLSQKDDIKDAVKIIKEVKKHQWHDLRENPDDLPDVNTSAMLGVIARGEEVRQTPVTYHPESGWYDCIFNVYEKDIVAWREIEEYE